MTKWMNKGDGQLIRSFRADQTAAYERKQLDEAGRLVLDYITQATETEKNKPDFQSKILGVLKGKGFSTKIQIGAINMAAGLDQHRQAKLEANQKNEKHGWDKKNQSFTEKTQSWTETEHATNLETKAEKDRIAVENGFNNYTHMVETRGIEAAEAATAHLKSQTSLNEANTRKADRWENPSAKPRQKNKPSVDDKKMGYSFLMSDASKKIKGAGFNTDEIRFNEAKDADGNHQITVAVKDIEGALDKVKELLPGYDIDTMDQQNTEIFDTSWWWFKGNVKGKTYSVTPKHATQVQAAWQAANPPENILGGMEQKVGLQTISNKNAGAVNKAPGSEEVVIPPGIGHKSALENIAKEEARIKALPPGGPPLPAAPQIGIKSPFPKKVNAVAGIIADDVSAHFKSGKNYTQNERAKVENPIEWKGMTIGKIQDKSGKAQWVKWDANVGRWLRILDKKILRSLQSTTKAGLGYLQEQAKVANNV